jgi:transposase
VPPLTATGSEFDAAPRRLHIQIDFAAGSRFRCPAFGTADRPAHDSELMTWRHIDLFEHQAYLHARVPRVRRAKCGLKRVRVL